MFRKTNPQKKLFGVDTWVPKGSRKRLRKTWAEVFKAEILPILLESEEGFSILYGETGRPNYSVRRMVGLCLLQEFNNLSDEEALDAFRFDIRWQYALDVSVDEDPYLSRRSLVEFRRRLACKDPEMKLMRGIFERISKTAIKKLNLSVSEQRVDSTHIVSNIHTHGRMDLFRKVLKHFLKSLEEERLAKVSKEILDWYTKEPEGWFGSGSLSEHREKLKKLSGYLYKLVVIFEKDKDVNQSEEYQILVQLLREQCEIVEDESVEKQAQQKRAEKPIEETKICMNVKPKKKPKGNRLESPYDPDASYGHKGSGYSAHITETCNNKDKKEIITDYEVHGAARSDMAKLPDVLDRLEAAENKPQKLYADGGYPSLPTTPMILERGVDLVAPVNRSRIPDEVMGRDRFEFDGNGHIIKCPAGYEPVDHRILSANNGIGRSLHAIFDGDTCRKCSFLEQCPVRTPNHRERGCKPRDTVGDFRLEITPALRLRDDMFANQQTMEWKQQYKIRSGVEATMSELKRAYGLGKLRVRRLPKVHFAVSCKVIACNIKRWAKALSNSPSTVGQYISLFLSYFLLSGTGYPRLSKLRSLIGLPINYFIEYV